MCPDPGTARQEIPGHDRAATRLTVAVASFPPRTHSAAALYDELTAWISRSGEDVDVITLADSDDVEDERIRAVVRQPRVNSGIAGQLSIMARAFRATLRTARGSEAVLAYSPPLGFALGVVAAARVLRIGAVVDIQDLQPKVLVDTGMLRPGPASWLLSLGERALYRLSSAQIVYSDRSAQHVIARGGRQVNVIPNWSTARVGAADPEGGRRLRSELGIARHSTVVTYGGSMGRTQDVGNVIDAAALLADADIHFVLAGDGPERDELQARSRSLDKVHWLPFQTGGAYEDLMLTSDICLVPLHAGITPETVPGKLANLMATGRPVVAVAPLDGDVAQLMDTSGCGVVVEPASPRSLAAELIDLAGDPERRSRWAENGRAFAQAHLTLDTCGPQYRKLLASVAR